MYKVHVTTFLSTLCMRFVFSVYLRPTFFFMGIIVHCSSDINQDQKESAKHIQVNINTDELDYEASK